VTQVTRGGFHHVELLTNLQVTGGFPTIDMEEFAFLGHPEGTS
jgi:hypothetical protein